MSPCYRNQNRYCWLTELRKHPRMSGQAGSSWPPEWTGPQSPNNPLPRGEAGILMRVEDAFNSVTAPHCFLSTRWNEREYFGCLFFDDERLSKQVFDTLTYLGSRMSDNGRLNIPVKGAASHYLGEVHGGRRGKLSCLCALRDGLNRQGFNS
jgi:hypothetical protein